MIDYMKHLLKFQLFLIPRYISFLKYMVDEMDMGVVPDQVFVNFCRLHGRQDLADYLVKFCHKVGDIQVALGDALIFVGKAEQEIK